MKTNTNNLMLTVVVAVIVAAVAFFGGMKYQQSRVPTGFGANGQFMRGTGGPGGFRFGGGRGANGAPVVGEVVSQDANSLTIKTMDGSTKIVNVSDTTTISKTDKGTKTDIKVGSRIAAFGTANSDGSVTAQNLQLNPMFRTGGPRQGVSVTPAP